MHGRALSVKSGGFGKRSDEALFISRFELMRVVHQRLQISHTEIAGAGSKDIIKNKREWGFIPAGAAAAYGHKLAVHIAAVFEISRGIDAILDIDNAPIPFQPLAIRASISRTSAII